jgi:hypothetical protein
MKFLKIRLQRLIAHQLPNVLEQVSDDNLEYVWRVLQSLYYDLYMLRAIQESKRGLQPGDTLTREEALQFLHFQ